MDAANDNTFARQGHLIPDAGAFRPELLHKYGKPGPRYTSYPPVPRWSDQVGPADYRTALEQAGQAADPFALYVHLPFCAARCWYCACNVTIQTRSEPVDRYLDHLEREAAEVVRAFGRRRRLSSVHLGGGTPNFLSLAQLGRLVGILRRYFNFDEHTEQAIELDARMANTGDVAAIVALGFNRLSFGVQDLNMAVGQAIGRVMNLQGLEARIAEGRAAGATNINVDILYGLPHQTPETIRWTLENTATRLRPDRLAFYGYAHVPWLRPQQRVVERAGLPSPAERVALFSAGLQHLGAHGYQPIGMDHFALPSDPLMAARDAGTLRRNFMGYTTESSPDLIGLGTTAIGLLSSAERPFYAQNAKAVKPYERMNGLATVRGHALTDNDVLVAEVIQRVMCQEQVQTVHGKALWQHFPHVRESLAGFEEDGLVVLDDIGLRVTPLGRLFLRPIAMQFDEALAQPMARYSAAV